MMEKKEKKGFWASLFSPKPCKCACGHSFRLPSDPPRETAADGPCGTLREIRVLGQGCAKCKRTFAVVEKVVRESGLDVQLTKVEDIEEIMRYNLLSTPAVAILTAGEDAPRVVVKGKVPTEAEVRQLLGL